MGRIFGTDGARGVANTELSCELAMQIGRAAAIVLTSNINHERPKVMIGLDTRISSEMLEAAITAGLCSVGADVLLLGVVPTPAVAFLVKKYNYDAGIMISASHNPCEYNGIKIFKGDGYKLPDELEEQIEDIIFDERKRPVPVVGAKVGRVERSETALFDYVEHLKTTVEDCDFSHTRIAIDCANGSSSVTAPELFMSLGALCDVFSASPNGININDKCGSTHMDQISDFVRENGGCAAGFAFDGDADRLLAVDENGDLVDGDKIIAICAKYLKDEGKLTNDTAVVTVMSNMGFFKFCEENGIKCEKTKVGDRYVLENMRENGNILGGEQSGHVIFHEYASTGDGQVTALQLLKIMKKTGKKLSELASQMTKYPQVIRNVRVSAIGKARFNENVEVKKAIESAENRLGDEGRVLVRVSGTEPVVRVMLEGKDEKLIKKLCDEISAVVEASLI